MDALEVNRNNANVVLNDAVVEHIVPVFSQFITSDKDWQISVPQAVCYVWKRRNSQEALLSCWIVLY
jgi:hypothetical protein